MHLSLIISILWSTQIRLATSTSVDKRTNATALCSTLGLPAFGASQVIGVGDGTYDELREAHWSQTAWETPGCIYLPTNANEVATALTLLHDASIQFAVKGGGHSPIPNWGNINGGVLLSMSQLTELKYNAESQTVRVGAGNTWGQVYDLLAPQNRVIVAARERTVGFGMLAGGGLSHHSNQYGFAGDNVVEYEVVLANGTIVTASASTNTDLYWALKGGGNSFGITTSATFRTYPQGKAWGGQIVYNGSQQDAIMRAFAEYQTNGQLDKNSALMSYVGVNNDTIIVAFAYLAEADRPQAYAPFYKIPALADTTGPKNSFAELLEPEASLGPTRWSSTGTTFFLNATAYVDIARIAQNISMALKTVNGGTMLLFPQLISKSMIIESVRRGESPLNAGLQEREQTWLSILVGWNFAADDAKVAAIMKNTISEIEKYTNKAGLYSEFLFLSDADATQDPLRRYGMNALRRLRRTGKDVDPTGLFQTLMPGGFKLNRGD